MILHQLEEVAPSRFDNKTLKLLFRTCMPL